MKVLPAAVEISALGVNGNFFLFYSPKNILDGLFVIQLKSYNMLHFPAEKGKFKVPHLIFR